MHEGGEVDVRGTYCALAAAALTGVLTPQLKQGATFVVMVSSWACIALVFEVK